MPGLFGHEDERDRSNEEARWTRPIARSTARETDERASISHVRVLERTGGEVAAEARAWEDAERNDGGSF